LILQRSGLYSLYVAFYRQDSSIPFSKDLRRLQQADKIERAFDLAS